MPLLQIQVKVRRRIIRIYKYRRKTDSSSKGNRSSSKAEKTAKSKKPISILPPVIIGGDKKQTASEKQDLILRSKRAINPNLIESILGSMRVLNLTARWRKRNQLFCGSLNINLRDGRWYRFSDGSKEIFALVKEATELILKERLR